MRLLQRSCWALTGLSSGIVHTLGLGFWSLAHVLLFHTLNRFNFACLLHARRWFLGFYKRAAGLQHPFCGVSCKPCGQLRDLGTRRDQKTIKKQLHQYTNNAAETVHTVERAEKAWRDIVLGPDDFERARDQAFDQHAKGTLFDDDRCELEPDGDAVDEFDPLGDELSDGEEDDTDPPEDWEDAQHDVTVKPEPPPEDTDPLPEPALPVTNLPSRLAALRIVYGRPTDQDLQAAASTGAHRES